MYKRSLLFDVQHDGASPSEDDALSAVRSGHPQCRALVKFEPIPEWLMLYFKSEAKK